MGKKKCQERLNPTFARQSTYNLQFLLVFTTRLHTIPLDREHNPKHGHFHHNPFVAAGSENLSFHNQQFSSPGQLIVF